MSIQTRSEQNGIANHLTLQDAFSLAHEDKTVWKISFEAEDGSRIRLVRTEEGWVYENVLTGSRWI